MLHVERLRAREALFAEWPQWADPELVRGYAKLHIAKPWVHQAEAATSLFEGNHTSITTSTGSGKSLAFWLPAITEIHSYQPPLHVADTARRPTVIYLSPTKALAADQLAALDRLLTAAKISSVRVSTLDGDTPTEERRWVRQFADVVLTNPDLLHFSLLQRHSQWARLLRSLRYVIVDEAHAYRGVFGAHVALVLRRLRRVAQHYRSDPRFLVASATTAHPARVASRLIGVPAEDVVAVTSDGSPQGRRSIVLWEPPLLPGRHTVMAPDDMTVEAVDARVTDDVQNLRRADGAGPVSGSQHSEHGEASGDDSVGSAEEVALARRSATSETADLLTDLTVAGARSLVFVKSRRQAETVAATTRRMLSEIDPELAESVTAYRSGYLPEERRAIEKALRNGQLSALATTSALELGIDVSGLDAVILAGWPGTMASFWQRVGRAGRAGEAGLAFLVASDDPLDTFLVHHPEAIFGTPVEDTVFDPDNPYILAPHLCAAAAECPLTETDLALFGPLAPQVLEQLMQQGLIRHRPRGWFWARLDKSPAALTDLRGSGGPAVRIIEANTGVLLGTVDRATAPRSTHPGAVYLHRGAQYLVEHLDLDEGVAIVVPFIGDYTTYAGSHSHVDIVEERETSSHGPVTLATGSARVTDQVVSFQRRTIIDGRSAVVDTIPLDLPKQVLQTSAVWWTLTEELLEQAEVHPSQLPGSLHAVEHAAIGLLPLFATCDRWDLGGLSTALHPDTELPTIIVYDGFPGGAGFAHRGYTAITPWLTATRDALAACECANGCPSCVQSPKCGNFNQPLDKGGALRLLSAMLPHLSEQTASG